VRVVIAEDSVLLREGIAKLLTTNGIEVVAAVGDADALLDAVRAGVPDLALVDIRMPPTFTDEGLRAALALKRQRPDLAVLVLSQYVEERYATDLLSDHTRGLGYLLKDRVADVADFVDAVRRVAAGGTVLDPEVVAQFVARRRRDPRTDLTARETDVLRLMAEGRSNSAVAAGLGISGHSVEKYVNSIFTKFGLPPSGADHRRVLAVLRFLQIGPGG
jgi:DNA-binding NarL/FixJ family response regulator